MNIDGLTERQVELLDTMWEIEEYEDLELWKATLCQTDRAEAENLQRLVILEAFEELVNDSKYHEANMVIDRIRKL